jgi:hypothetical protein
MHIRLELSSTETVTAELSEAVKIAIKPRDNFALDSVGAVFEVAVAFVISAANHKAVRYAASVTVRSDLRTTGCTAYLFTGTSEVRGRFTLSAAKVSRDGAAYSGTFTVGSGDWLVLLKNLNEYNYGDFGTGTFTHTRANIEAVWAGVPSKLYFHELYYQTPMHPTAYFDIMEAAPSVYIKTITDAIFASIKSTGYALDAPFFETDFYKNLLFQKFKGWASIPNIYSDNTKVRAQYNIANFTAIHTNSLTGEFLPTASGAGYGEDFIHITESFGGLLQSLTTHPVMPIPIPHSGAYGNVTNTYIAFVAPSTGYYNINALYEGNKAALNATGFYIFKNGVPFSDVNGNSVSKMDGSVGGNFSAALNVNVLLNVGDVLQWCRHEQLAMGGVTPYGAMVTRNFNIIITKQQNVAEGLAYNIKDLLPADNAALLLRGLFEAFNLVINTHGTVITIAPMFGVTLYTGEFVEGFYELNKPQTITENCEYADNYKGAERNKDYFWSYADDSKDMNINKGQLFSGHLLYQKNPLPQKQMNNSYFAPTYSEHGICYILTNSSVKTSYTGWLPSTYDHTPRLLYKSEKLSEPWEWYSAGNFLSFRPVAFLADPNLALYPLTFEPRGSELGLIQRFWQTWATWLQTTFDRVMDNKQLPFDSLDARRLLHLYGAWWILSEIENIDLGCETEITGEQMTVKLQFIEL